MISDIYPNGVFLCNLTRSIYGPLGQRPIPKNASHSFLATYNAVA